MSKVDVPSYLDLLPASLLARLDEESEPVPEVPGLRVARGLRRDFPAIETAEALALVVEVYVELRGELARVLEQRKRDRAFLDERVAASVARNAPRAYDDPAYETPIGLRDEAGRVVMGPSGAPLSDLRVDVPAFLAGDQVTLFGPPDTARMAINAMNAMHRRRPGEPPLVAELLDDAGSVPRWGADNEDSKTPIMSSYLAACQNLVGCFDGTLRYDDEVRGRSYELAKERLAIPIKRIPGLALPDGSHLFEGNPLPLHLYDLVLHLWHSRAHEEALVFYVPKLENEEEAAYLRSLIEASERAVARRDPSFLVGRVRILVVFENPRAIFRIQDMAAALGPYFLGGSLGWHDFLASTARLFRNDPRYRIPVKADPDIVINHIKESHDILARSLAPLGALKLGGMYGVLFEEGNEASYAVSMIGFVRDVVTQLKRGLDGFWVAHPDFVRIGLALVAAFRRHERDATDDTLPRLVSALVTDPDDQSRLLDFILGPDVAGLAPDDPRYLRGVLAADLEMSPLIANDDPEEVRYNIFQALQYLADWLCGNGCVALPAALRDRNGDNVFVRIMDDLATTERSRWELWAEVHHGRVPVALFERILAEEVAFLQTDLDTEERRIQVRWRGEAARWYPVAVRLLRLLVTTAEPPEFVPELMLPFTFDVVRSAADPWAAALALCPEKLRGAEPATE
jgi:malate synthase